MIAALAMALGVITEMGRLLFPSWVYFLAWMELWAAALSVAGSIAVLAVWPAPGACKRSRGRSVRLRYVRPQTWRVLPPPRDEAPAFGVRDGMADRSRPHLGCHEEE